MEEIIREGARVIHKISFKAIALVTTIPPFPEKPFELEFDHGNKKLNNCLDTILKDQNVDKLCGACVDLTGDPAKPSYFGINDEEMLYVGSLAKVYAMYAAFELRSRVEAQANRMVSNGLSTDKKGWEKEVYALLKTVWQPILDEKFPPPFPKEKFPKLDSIFSLQFDGKKVTAKFKERSPRVTLQELSEASSKHDLARKAEFGDNMSGMLLFSSNESAGECISALSYPYINGALEAAGFFNKKDKSGLWLSGNYKGRDWLGNDQAGQKLKPRWAQLQNRGASNMTGTASQVARFMALLAQGKLIDKNSSDEMINMMNQGQGSNIFIKVALETYDSPFSSIVSKIGIGNDSTYHDCGIVTVKRDNDPAKTVRYVSVVLGGLEKQGHNYLYLAYFFNHCILSSH